MTVSIYLANGVDTLENVASFDTVDGAVRIRQAIAEEKSASGLIARVGGRSRFLLYPWHRILRVEVEE